jgi:hypothetical protein
MRARLQCWAATPAAPDAEGGKEQPKGNWAAAVRRRAGAGPSRGGAVAMQQLGRAKPDRAVRRHATRNSHLQSRIQLMEEAGTDELPLSARRALSFLCRRRRPPTRTRTPRSSLQLKQLQLLLQLFGALTAVADAIATNAATETATIGATEAAIEAADIAVTVAMAAGCKACRAMEDVGR